MGGGGGGGAALLLSPVSAGLPDFPSVTPLLVNPRSPSLCRSLTIPHYASSAF